MLLNHSCLLILNVLFFMMEHNPYDSEICSVSWFYLSGVNISRF